jgi:phosphoenolpyruvate carboxylase
MGLLEAPDKDLPLRDDIRLLGRILGDTVRSQEGEPVFAIVERIRRTSIRCRCVSYRSLEVRLLSS